MTNAALRARLYVAALAILSIGLAAGLLIYATAEEAPPEAIGYIVVDGLKYPLAANQSKRYIRDLERFGGKASVVFDEFGRWFGSLWQGSTLGLTLACLSAFISVVLALFARSLPDK